MEDQYGKRGSFEKSKRRSGFFKTLSRMQNDKEAVLAAVQQEGMALKYISDKLKNDPNIIMAAIGYDPIEECDYVESIKSGNFTINSIVKLNYIILINF